jgi:phage/plasmid-associated DNA primase
VGFLAAATEDKEFESCGWIRIFIAIEKQVKEQGNVFLIGRCGRSGKTRIPAE